MLENIFVWFSLLSANANVILVTTLILTASLVIPYLITGFYVAFHDVNGLWSKFDLRPLANRKERTWNIYLKTLLTQLRDLIIILPAFTLLLFLLMEYKNPMPLPVPVPGPGPGLGPVSSPSSSPSFNNLCSSSRLMQRWKLFCLNEKDSSSNNYKDPYPYNPYNPDPVTMIIPATSMISSLNQTIYIDNNLSNNVSMIDNHDKMNLSFGVNSFYMNKIIWWILFEMFNIFFVIVINQLWRYYIHGLFHVFPVLYKKVHKVHHAALVDVHALNVWNNHIIEFLLMEIPGLLMPFYFINVDALVYALFFAYTAIQASLEHSGFYVNDWIDSRYHWYHHTNIYKHYADMPIFDKIFGTD